MAVSLATALAVNLATNTIRVTGRWWPVAVWISVVALYLIAVAIERARIKAGPERAPESDLEDMAITLAGEVKDQWAHEAVLRQVFQPVPLDVRWSSTGRPVAASRDVVLDEPSGTDWQQLPLRGDAGEIVAAFQGLPHGQLVVLGLAGAGKSILAILLTLGLMKKRQAGQPVPVLLPIASWNPDAESTHAFILRRLGEEYKFLTKPAAAGQNWAELLMARKRVLPVLDGMDELPAHLHTKAVESLDRFAAEGHPLVVTCRSREYEQAIVRSGSILSRSAVVEIEPVNVEQAIAFLSHPAPSRHRWQPVFGHLANHPDGPLARVLSTPLMVALARAAYRSPDSDPAALLAVADSAALSGSLIDGFVKGAYQTGLPQSHGAEIQRLRDYDAEHAVRWLSCLAYHLYLTGTRDFWWWQFTPSLLSPRPNLTRRMIPVLWTVAGTGIGAAIGWAIRPSSALWAAGAAAVIVATNAASLFRPMWGASYPPYVAPRYRTPRQRRIHYAGVRMAFGLIFGLAAGQLTNNLLLGLTGGFACGIASILIPGTTVRTRARLSTPRLTLRTNRRNIVSAAIQYGVIGGVIFAAVARIGPGNTTAWVAGAIAALIYALAAAYGAGLWTWTQFRSTHLLLIAHGWLPWRLSIFLEDAHSRGALRQAGTAWQFRHALLQDHLARKTHLNYLRTRAAVGHLESADQLVNLLTGQGRVDEAIAFLRARAVTRDRNAMPQLTGLLAAQGRMDEAIAFLRARADAGDRSAAWQLAELLAWQDRADEAITLLRPHAESGDRAARWRLAELLAGQGRADEAITLLRPHAGNPDTAQQLAELLARQGRADEAITLLRPHTGNPDTAQQLAELLARQGRADEAITLLRSHIGDGRAVRDLASFMARQGRADEAIRFLRARVDAGDRHTVRELAHFLVNQRKVDEAITLLHSHADAGDGDAAYLLANLLVRQRRVDEAIRFLRARVDAGSGEAVHDLAGLLAEQGQADEAIALLRIRVDAEYRLRNRGKLMRWLMRCPGPHRRYMGVPPVSSAQQLAFLLAKQGLLDELRTRAEAGDSFATDAAVGLLIRRGRIDEATTFLRIRADAGDREAGERLPYLMACQGRMNEAVAFMRARAGASDRVARELADLLTGEGRMEEAAAFLRARADAGDEFAASQIVNLLAGEGRMDEAVAFLRSRADAGDGDSARQLADLLAKLGRGDEAIAVLRVRADAGDKSAAQHFADLLAKLGRGDEAIAVLRVRADAGDKSAAQHFAGLLAKLGQADEAIAILRPLTDAGSARAARQLAGLLAGQDQIDEAIEILRRHADAGSTDTARQLADLLTKLGRTDEAIAALQHHAAGTPEATQHLVDLLVAQGRGDEATAILRARIDANDWYAVPQLADLLTKLGRVGEAIAVLRTSADWEAGRQLADLLAGQGQVDEAIVILQVQAYERDWAAVRQLIGLLAKRRQVDA